MKLNIELLKKYITDDFKDYNVPELLASIGIEVDETEKYKNTDIYTIEITPNRPDWLSHIGIARDLSAKISSAKYLEPEYRKVNKIENNSFPRVRIKDPGDCPRYTYAVIKNIKVKESDEEVKDLLLSLGLRPVNNIVDISNLVMMITGHPNHIFDLKALNNSSVEVRRAVDGEHLTLLDGTEVELTDSDLCICDKDLPIALAGIMGGKDSGVNENTEQIFIESAAFNPVPVRKTARKRGIITDASYRFERGCDITATEMAIELAVNMVMQSCREAELVMYQDNYPAEYCPPEIEFSKDYISKYTGVEFTEQEIVNILDSLGFGVSEKNGNFIVTVPGFRVDVSCKQDIVEEVIRIHGYDKLGSVLPLTFRSSAGISTSVGTLKKTREFLRAVGFNEAYNYNFISPDECSTYRMPVQEVELKNPLGRDYSVLRTSLLPGLVRNTVHNFNNGADRVFLFETGRIFSFNKRRVSESKRIGISGFGKHLRQSWKDGSEKVLDFYTFRSYIDLFFRSLNVKYELKASEYAFFEGNCSWDIILNGEKAGFTGMIRSDILSKTRISDPLFYMETGLYELDAARSDFSFRMWSKYPETRKDFSFIIDKDIKFSEIESKIEEFKSEELRSCELFDLYKGKGLDKGTQSMSMSFIYNRDDRTLTSEEANELHKDLKNKLIKEFKLKQR